MDNAKLKGGSEATVHFERRVMWRELRRTKMSTVCISANVELAELVEMIIDDVLDHETIRNFILALDAAVADYDFTVDLRDKLNEAIANRAASAT